MTLQITTARCTYSNLSRCLVREMNSDNHAFDIHGVASGLSLYAHALKREASSRRRDRRARRAAAH